MKKLSLGEIDEHVQGHTTGKRQSRNLNTENWSSRVCVLNSHIILRDTAPQSVQTFNLQFSSRNLC